jgi:hypothetical protein
MRLNRTPQTWRLLQLAAPYRRCVYCGDEHEYLTRRPRHGYLCCPILFPPGVAAPTAKGVEVETFVEGLEGRPGETEEAARYRMLTRRVAEMAIRCERCGERFEEIDTYLMHSCEIRYR